MIIPNEIEIIEVGPRDELQNEPILIPTAAKKELIKKLADTGHSRIEATSFVSPKWVTQMAHSAEICQFCRELNIAFIALTPNVKALNQAIEQRVPQIAIFVGASTTFNKKNINRTTEESLAECELLFQIAQRKGIFIRAYISTAFFCPYQGRVYFAELNDVCRKFVELGADEIDISKKKQYS